MPLVAVYDANVIYPATVRDVLIRAALGGLVQAKWTDQILDEAFSNLQTNRPDLTPEALRRTRTCMTKAVRDCLITGYEPLVEAIHLPDPDDRHVLAAAVHAQAQVIVTFNLKDFPAEVLAPWNVHATHPDLFIDILIDQDPQSVYDVIEQISESCNKPPLTPSDVIDSIEQASLPISAASLRNLS